jgi:hypothetical protein
MQPLTLPAQAGAIKITPEQLLAFGIQPEDSRGELTTLGPWHIPVTFKALAVSYVFSPNHRAETVTIYGIRTMGKLKESGYQLEGRVSIAGKKRRGFTDSQLWELPDGRLMETAIIQVCK